MESLSERTSTGYQQIHDGIIHLVDSARTETVRSVNALMTATYWEIGRRIVEFEQGGEARAAYGAQLIKRLSKDLSLRYKRGFSAKNLRQMRLFYLFFNMLKFADSVWRINTIGIPQTPSAEFPWAKIWQTLSAKSFPLPCPPTSVYFPLKTLTPAAFMKRDAPLWLVCSPARTANCDPIL